MEYCIVSDGTIQNVIVCAAASEAKSLGAMPWYDGARIGDVYDPPATQEAKDQKQEQNKSALSAWLAAHPLTWTDGKQYGVEEQDQNEMALNLMQYQAAQTAQQTAPLEWHAQKEQCRSFTPEEYISLSMAISAYVYPYRRYQESVKAAIYQAETQGALEAIAIDYSSVSNE